MTATDWTESTVPADIAIIGMACKVPGADDTGQYWANLREGVESITQYTDAQLRERGVSQELLDNPRYVKAAAELQGVEGFDAAFFGLSARETELMDPQHRLFLECAYAALDDAAYDPRRYDGLIGVYGGSTMNTYLLFNLMSNRNLLHVVGDQQTMIGNDKEYLASRVSYKLGLTGPSVAVQTACSTSLASVHVAAQSLLSGECDMALAGGASLRMPHNAGYLYQPGGTSSPDGHCRAFDARAAGSVVGSGAGVVVLKHLADAQRDGDHVYAVIKGTALNNDGSAKMSFTSPSVDGQARAIASALANAGLSGDDIDYVECHGTGTKLGDPIEVAALTKGFRATTDERHSVALGSTKTNIGHLDAAAGVSGLIKAVLCLRHRMIPATLHFESPNPEIDFDNSPFYVNAALRDWDKPEGVPRRAGVNSLGMGGTNAHVILEEAPEQEPTAPATRHQLLTLSAATQASLDMATERIGNWLRTNPQSNLADVAHTLRSRKPHQVRRTVVARDCEDAAFALNASGSSRVHTEEHTSEPGGAALLFPGQGSQRPGAGAALYRTEPVFAEAADACLDAFSDEVAEDLRRLLLDPAAQTSPAAGDELRDTALAQPALFLTGYALAALLRSYGLRFEATAGHSIGEIVSACVAGVFTVEDAARLVEARGRLVAACPPGAMLSIPLPEDDVRDLLSPGLSIAAVNGPSLVAVSGAQEDVDALASALEGKGVAARRLVVSHAFHSSMLDPAVEEFRDVVASVELREPATPFVSNVTGTWITAEEATDPDYWARHLREPVRFWDCLRTLADAGSEVFVECGPGRALTTLTRQLDGDSRWALPVLAERPGEDDRLALLEAVGRLWRNGIELDWTSGSGTRRRVPLPTYAFDRRRYWVDPPTEADAPPAATSTGAQHAVEAAAAPGWLYDWSWRRLPESRKGSVAGRPVVLAGSMAHAVPLAGLLEQHGCAVGLISGPEDDAVAGDRHAARDDVAACSRLVASLSEQSEHAPTLVFLAGQTGNGDDAVAGACDAVGELAEVVDLLAGLDRRARLVVVTRGAYDVTGVEAVDPVAAAVAAAARVVPQEQPQIETAVVDLPSDAVDTPPAAVLRTLSENRPTPYPRAWRGARLWEVDILPSDEEPLAHASSTEPGTYLVVGAAGTVGSGLVEVLADSGATTVVAIDIDTGSIRERADGSVRAYHADVTDPESLRTVLEKARDAHGSFRGAFFCAGPNDAVVAPLTGGRRDVLASHVEVRGRGVEALAAALPATGAEWCVAVSSLATLLGGVGNGAYAASHAVMDALIAKESSVEGGPRWLAVDLDHWGVDVRGERALTDVEGVTVLRYLGESGRAGSVLLSMTDLVGRMRDAAAAEQDNRDKGRSAEPAAPNRGGHPRPDISTPYMAPRDELEERVVAAYAEMLGLDRVGVHDSFFELGGDSLMAMQLITRLRDEHGVDIPVPTLFESVTIANIASHIREAGDGPSSGGAAPPAAPAPDPQETREVEASGDALDDVDPEELQSILAEIESLSDEEVQQRLEGSG
jgi:phthiocerol/phenolphthiocerol synthesis type-I polyketide synthase E